MCFKRDTLRVPRLSESQMSNDRHMEVIPPSLGAPTSTSLFPTGYKKETSVVQKIKQATVGSNPDREVAPSIWSVSWLQDQSRVHSSHRWWLIPATHSCFYNPRQH